MAISDITITTLVCETPSLEFISELKNGILYDKGKGGFLAYYNEVLSGKNKASAVFVVARKSGNVAGVSIHKEAGYRLAGGYLFSGFVGVYVKPEFRNIGLGRTILVRLVNTVDGLAGLAPVFVSGGIVTKILLKHTGFKLVDDKKFVSIANKEDDIIAINDGFIC